MEQQGLTQRRSFQRVKFTEPVQFQYKGTSVYGGSVASDISEDGIQLKLNDFFPIHTQINLQVHLSHEKVIECIGRIVWIEQLPYSERYKAGIQFIPNSVSGEPKEEIHRFLLSQKSS